MIQQIQGWKKAAVKFEMSSAKSAIDVTARSLKTAQETKSSKLRSSLVQHSFLDKKLAAIQRGGVQVIAVYLPSSCNHY